MIGTPQILNINNKDLIEERFIQFYNTFGTKTIQSVKTIFRTDDCYVLKVYFTDGSSMDSLLRKDLADMSEQEFNKWIETR